ncbi:unnamed protein product, partial [Prorocentrum cordatum]
ETFRAQSRGCAERPSRRSAPAPRAGPRLSPPQCSGACPLGCGLPRPWALGWEGLGVQSAVWCMLRSLPTAMFPCGMASAAAGVAFAASCAAGPIFRRSDGHLDRRSNHWMQRGHSAADPPAAVRAPGHVARRAAGAAAAAACAAAAVGPRRRPRARRGGGRIARCAGTSMNLDIDIIKKVDKKDQAMEESKTSGDFWAVMAHAPIVNCNCNSPLNKLPFVKRWTCKCPGSRGSKVIKTKDGRCALTVTEYAEVLSQGIPLLSRNRAYKVASTLFESALANPVGTVMIIGTFKTAAKEYEERLTALGLWVSTEEVSRD